jgi:hypothetical protein
MKKPIGFAVGVFLAGSASLAAAQFGGEVNKPTSITGWDTEIPAQPAIEPVPPRVDTPRMAGNVPLTSCDSAGCWGANGTRYTRAGNTLFGTNGVVCTIGAPGAPAMCN